MHQKWRDTHKPNRNRDRRWTKSRLQILTTVNGLSLVCDDPYIPEVTTESVAVVRIT